MTLTFSGGQATVGRPAAMSRRIGSSTALKASCDSRISRRASDVWKVLGAVKTEFGKFGDIVDATRKKLEAASKQFDQVDVRTRAIQRQLRQVEALPAVEAEQLLADSPDSEVLAEAQHLPPA